jgi:hypothetical protein
LVLGLVLLLFVLVFPRGLLPTIGWAFDKCLSKIAGRR